jgi:hypothetical protein
VWTGLAPAQLVLPPPADPRVRVAHSVAFCAFVMLGIPALVATFGAIFGGIIAGAEAGWTFRQGLLYVLSNTLGLPNPLTNVMPVSNEGIAVSIIVGSIALASISTLMGMVGLFALLDDLFGAADGRGPGGSDE